MGDRNLADCSSMVDEFVRQRGRNGGRWVAVDDSSFAPVEKVRAGNWKVISAQATPGFNSGENAYFTGDLAALVDVTAHLSDVKPLRFHTEDGGAGSALVSVWNTLGWRKAAVARRDEEESNFRVSLGQPKGVEVPVLLTVVRDGQLSWGFSRVDAEGGAVLNEAKPGVCIQWPQREVSK